MNVLKKKFSYMIVDVIYFKHVECACNYIYKYIYEYYLNFWTKI